MKLKNLLSLLLFVCAVSISRANTFTVEVSNFQFSPANLTVNVGDTIHWVWSSGFHTTTSTSVPTGADTWDAPIQKSGDTFDYVIMVAGNYNYFCSIHPLSMLGTITASGALPVVLSKFSVAPGKSTGSALLQWSTATETNTDKFVIQKSTNAADYADVTSVKAAGNSSTLNNYSVTDNNVGSTYKYIYYRLAIVDKDGSKTYSTVQKFINGSAAKKLITQISPNPVAAPGHLMFQFNADNDGEMLVQLFDPAGKLVKQANMQAYSGLNNGHFHMGELASGTYNVVFSMAGIKESYKIVMQ